MSWIRSSEGAILGALLVVVVVGTAGTAAALSVSGSPPGSSQVGSTVSMTATIEQPFSGNAPAQYTLQGETELANASFTVVAMDQQNNTVNRVDSPGPSFEMPLDLENGAVRVEVRVNNGQVPALTGFDYRDMSVENYTVLSLERVKNGAATDIETFSAHRHTADSQAARAAIDEAVAAVDDSASSDAKSALNDSISFYNTGSFDQAIDNANDAKEKAEASGGGSMLLFGAIAVVALVVIVVGLYLWRGSGEEESYKLQ